VNTRDKQSQLALHRLQQADESLEEARFLYEGRKSARSIINRAYYSMFYSILALLIYEPFSSSKHSGVISYFNRNFIKAGIFSKRLGGCPRIASLPRKKLKIFSDILMFKT